MSSVVSNLKLRAVVTFVVVASVIIVGTLGYSFIEKQPLLNSFYIMSMIFTAQGPPSEPTTKTGLIFTAIMAYISIGVLVSSIGFIFGPLLISGLKSVVERVEASFDLKNHIIICGYNEMSRLMIKELKKEGKYVAVIDDNQETVDSLILNGTPAVRGEGSSTTVLRKARIDEASALAACYLDDSKNAFTILTAKSIRPDIFCVSRVTEEENVEKLKMVKADRIVSPAVVGAKMMLEELTYREKTGG